jgi:dolichyl-phosphate-mannose-protein mannosyltransferase
MNAAPARARLLWLLAAGLAARIAVWVVLSPFNNDDHAGVIAWILRTGRLPTSELGNQTFQPPLYYLLALPWTIGGSAKLLQAFSLVLSLANLFLLYRFLRDTPLLETEASRRQGLALAAVLPQFVIFGNFVSNDSLAFVVGTVVFLQAFRYAATGSRRDLLLLAAALGAGLLTKGTFLAFFPVLMLLVWFIGVRRGRGLRQHLAALLLFTSVACAVGSYKYLENLAHFGRPIVHGMDFRPGWMLAQQGTYRGIGSLLDVNVVRLVRDPFETAKTLHSYPLLLYSTFWYSYIPESNFQALRTRARGLARLTAGAALLPTLLMIAGALAASARCLRSLRLPSKLPEEVFVARTREALAVLLFLSNLAIVVAAGVKYDAWSCFQGRLLFPSLAAILLFLGWGLDAILRRFPGWGRAADAGLWAVDFLFAADLAVEAGAVLASRLRKS